MWNCLSLYNVELFETLNILVFFLGLGSVSLIRFHLREDSVLIVLVKLLIAYFFVKKREMLRIWLFLPYLAVCKFM